MEGTKEFLLPGGETDIRKHPHHTQWIHEESSLDPLRNQMGSRIFILKLVSFPYKK